jgi:hypothetical protein
MKFATTFAAMMIAGMLPLASASQPASQGLRQVVNRPRSRPWRCSLPGKRHDRCVADSKHRRLGHRHHHRNRQWQRDHRYEHVPGRRQPAVHKRICVRQHRGHFLRDRRGQSVNIFSFYGQMTPPTGNAYGELTSNPGAFGVGTFTLTAATGTLSAVPEASTWAMMVIGFAGLGIAGYRASLKRAGAAA